jgi:POT family proton-dependent oligopeptide transporter
VGILVKNFLELGFWISGRFLCCSDTTVLFYSGHIGDIGLKPTASKQSQEKAAAENTPVNVVQDRIIAVLIFSVFSVLLGFV